MRSKFAVVAVAIASLVGSSLAASAQMQPAPGASSEGNVGPGATKSKTTKSKSMKKGMTTGMSSGMGGANKGDARNPSGQGNVGPGTDNNAGRNSGGK
jgi:opacity protein-like surface antigen